MTFTHVRNAYSSRLLPLSARSSSNRSSDEPAVDLQTLSQAHQNKPLTAHTVNYMVSEINLMVISVKNMGKVCEGE